MTEEERGGLKHYNDAAQKRIVELGKEVEDNLLELYRSLRGTGLDIEFCGGGKSDFNWMETYTTKVTETDEELEMPDFPLIKPAK